MNKVVLNYEYYELLRQMESKEFPTHFNFDKKEAASLDGRRFILIEKIKTANRSE